MSADEINIKKHEFQLNNDLYSGDVLPSYSFLNEYDEEIETYEKEGDLFTDQYIRELKLTPVPYDTNVDVLLIDEYGNTELIKKDVSVKNNKETIIPLEKEIIDVTNNQHRNKQFIMVINNRGEEIISDWKAVDSNKQPAPTSFQEIKEIPQKKEKQ